MIYKNEKTVLMIDGANLYGVARALEFDIDYKKLLRWAQDKTHILRAYYYTALLEDAEFSPIRPLVDWLDYNGYTIVTKAAREFTDSHGRRKIKGSIDVELTVDALSIAPQVDHIMLFTGDGDFLSLVKALQNLGKRVTVVSSSASQPSMVSDDLRRNADHFIELKSIAKDIARDEQDHDGQDHEVRQMLSK